MVPGSSKSRGIFGSILSNNLYKEEVRDLGVHLTAHSPYVDGTQSALAINSYM